MKHLLETLKSARSIELILLVVLVCVLIFMFIEGDSAYKPSREAYMAETLSAIHGAGKVRVLLSGEEQISGAVVLCEGADNISVMLDLQRSVQILTGLPLDKIEIIKGE